MSIRSEVQLLPVSHINLTHHTYTRGGVLPYSLNSRGETIYWFGVDSETYQLADFGGGRDALDNDVLDTAIREYAEESFNLLPPLTRGNGYHLQALVRRNNILILYPISLTHDPSYYLHKAHELAQGNLYFETQALVCLNHEQIIALLDKGLFNPHLAVLVRRWMELQSTEAVIVPKEHF